MKRIIDYYLLQWKHSSIRKPLLLRGARQVGKTFAVRNLGKTYDNFVEINFEVLPEARTIFEQNLYPERIIQDLFILTKKRITPGKTLLFFDEIQTAPKAITALRYFYELMPELHVIAAGSLLDFTIQEIGIPVGRVEFLYMYPLSFVEYLAALQENIAIEQLLQHDPSSPLLTVFHDQLLKLVGQYLALGGMPEVIHNWTTTKNPFNCNKIHTGILKTYRQDFPKYAKTLSIKYVELIFEHIPEQLGRKFKYSIIEGDFRKRELAPALDLLITAGVAHKVYYSAGQGIPIGAQTDPLDYKVLFLDIGLAQHHLGVNLQDWFLNSQQEFINKGSVVEAFVGQEMATYATPADQYRLYYWHKDSAPQQAEIDYLLQINQKIIPIEVKSGQGKTLKSIHYFLETHKNSPYGLRFSANNYSQLDNIHSYPLYAIFKVMIDHDPEMKAAIENLII